MKIDYWLRWTPKEGKATKVNGIDRLKEAIGENNANKVIREALALKEDKKTLKFRKYGKIEIYLK